MFLNGQFILAIIFLIIMVVGFALVVDSLIFKKKKLDATQKLIVILGSLLVIVGSYFLCITLVLGY